MSIKNLIKGVGVKEVLEDILKKIHVEGPIDLGDLEKLSLIKKHYPNIFVEYENKLISLMGLFYKRKEPGSLIEELYSIYADSIKEDTNNYFTPVQSDAYKQIKDHKFFSFSAPTSAGKSFLFREIIKESEGDIIIVVPSRALISEYINKLTNIVDKDVLVLPFIEVVNTKHTIRKIFVITPERGGELFKNLHKLNVDIFLFDEAQITEEKIRGMKFDSFVRRVSKLVPNAKKIFTHPFVSNPESQLKRHNFISDTSFKNYKQNAVGKIFMSYKDSKFHYFSPYTSETNIPANEDIMEDTLLNKGTLLIYTSKQRIYDEMFFEDFGKYINLCNKISEPKAVEYIKALQEFIGASDEAGDKHSTMIDMMERGIVFHHGSMPLKARLIIEEFVNKDFAKICFATSTLTQGINMPFDVVLIDNFKFNGSTEDIKTLDMKNLIGRAGRSLNNESKFDFGYVIVNNKNIKTFCSRVNNDIELSESSDLDNDILDIDEDLRDLAEAIKEDSFNDDFQLTQEQLSRISKTDLNQSIKFILDRLIIGDSTLTASDYYKIPKPERDEIKDSFKKIFISHLRRKKLSTAESSILSTAIPILLWQIEGKSFSQIVSLRHAFLSEKDRRQEINKRIEKGEITQEQAKEEIESVKIRFSPIAEQIPNSTISQAPLFKLGTSVTKVQYDRIVYDTYDYIDKVVSFSLKDPLSAALILYFQETYDVRALTLSNFINFGTNDLKEIWLIKYGFAYDDIEWIKDYVISISSEEIVFQENLKEKISLEQYQILNRYIYKDQ